MFKNNRNLLVIAIIALVNALGYAIIIPILPAYSERFGLNSLENAALFSLFSLCSFLSAPLIGRWSDKYGRRPLLIGSLAGTALSFFLMAFARNSAMLFVARALDGVTAGNIPVALAVISDTTEMKHRSKGFGIIGASFGFGFVFGPAISAFTVGVSPSLPFIIAGLIAVIAVVLTVILLPETNKHIGQVQEGKLFDFSGMFTALRNKAIGPTLLITLIYFLAFGMLIATFRDFGVKVIGLTDSEVGFTFTLFGIAGLLSQLFLVERISKWFGLKQAYCAMIVSVAVSYLGIFLSSSLLLYIPSLIVMAVGNAVVNPLTQTILSMETDQKSQGTVQGINAAYQNVAMIFGPLVGGMLAFTSVALPFLAGAILVGSCYYLARYFITLSPGKYHSM